MNCMVKVRGLLQRLKEPQKRLRQRVKRLKVKRLRLCHRPANLRLRQVLNKHQQRLPLRALRQQHPYLQLHVMQLHRQRQHLV